MCTHSHVPHVRCELVPKSRKMCPQRCHFEPFVLSVASGDFFLQAVLQDPSAHKRGWRRNSVAEFLTSVLEVQASVPSPERKGR